jgi:hypothetical protein
MSSARTYDAEVDFLRKMYDWEGVTWEQRRDQLVSNLLPNEKANALLAEMKQLEIGLNQEAVCVVKSRTDLFHYRILLKLNEWHLKFAKHHIKTRSDIIVLFLNEVHPPRLGHSWELFNGTICCIGPSLAYQQPSLFRIQEGALFYRDLQEDFSEEAIAAGFTDEVIKKFVGSLETDDHRTGCHYRLKSNVFVFLELYHLAVNYFLVHEAKTDRRSESLLRSSGGSSNGS